MLSPEWWQEFRAKRAAWYYRRGYPDAWERAKIRQAAISKLPEFVQLQVRKIAPELRDLIFDPESTVAPYLIQAEAKLFRYLLDRYRNHRPFAVAYEKRQERKEREARKDDEAASEAQRKENGPELGDTSKEDAERLLKRRGLRWQYLSCRTVFGGPLRCVLVNARICASDAEARRYIAQGGVVIDGRRHTDPAFWICKGLHSFKFGTQDAVCWSVVLPKACPDEKSYNDEK